MDRYLTVNTLAELCCLLVALFTLKGEKVRTWRYFPGLLLIALLAELSSIFLRRHGPTRTNWVYNIYGIFEIVFVSSMFWELLKGKVKRWSPFYLTLLLVVLAYCWETYLHGVNRRYDLTNSIFGIAVVLCALYYLKLLMADQHYVSLARDPNFWWIMGTIFFLFQVISFFTRIDPKICEHENRHNQKYNRDDGNQGGQFVRFHFLQIKA